jgi:protein phosphatase
MSGFAADPEDTGEHQTFDLQVAKHYESEPRTHARVKVAGRSHPGKVRPNNEDHYLVVRRYRGREILKTSLPKELLQEPEDHAYTLAVADGMGGRKFGDLASLLAFLTGWELGGNEIKWTVKFNEDEEKDLRHKAEVFFRLINRALESQVNENPRMAGMGTTLTLCYSIGHELFVSHAGDSRAYLFRSGELSQLTRDHNLAQFLVDSGVAERGSPSAMRMKHVLTNVLGGPEHGLVVDVDHYQLEDGDRLLLCTDGLNEMVKDAEIARTLAALSDPEDACAALEQLALERGAKDNVTVVIARFQFVRELSLAERFGPEGFRGITPTGTVLD